MASIAGISGWTGWDGQLVRSQRAIELAPPRPGTNDQVLLLGGWQTQPQRLVTRKLYAGATPLADALADELVCRQTMDGASKPVVDPLGRSWAVRVLGVQCRRFALIDGRALLEVEWELLVEVEANPPSN